MSIRLKIKGSNQTVLELGDSGEVLFSYETPVAGRHPRMGWVRCTQFYSPTTTKHVNAYLGENGKVEAQGMPPQFFDEWLNGVGNEQPCSNCGVSPRFWDGESSETEVHPVVRARRRLG